ncbi:MAG: hypothetical protein WBA13_07560 [Microcoleaceae cyanobacterium]
MKRLQHLGRNRLLLWLIASLILSLICSLWALSLVVNVEYAIHDDARSHIVWMFRFIDPDLFKNDIIFDYFQSVAPVGYTTFYKAFATIGIHPLTVNKLLPTLLGLITTGYCFGVCLQILPIPIAGFLSTLFLNQNLWLRDDLISATPRAFFYPFFLAFLYYLLKQSQIGIAITIVLLGVFYPQAVLLAVAVIIIQTLWKIQGDSKIKKNQLECLFSGLIIGFLILIPYALQVSEYGSIITLTEAKNLPEFYPGGRASFFTNNFFDFWITGDRSGFFPQEWLNKGFPPPQLFLGLLLPILLKLPIKFPLHRHITKKLLILPQLLLASIGLFTLAHLFLFKLHHPSRYSQHSLRIIFAIAASITVILIADKIRYIIRWKKTKIAVKFIMFCLVFLLLSYPSLLQGFPRTNYIFGKKTLLYEFFLLQPKDIRVASFIREVNNIPAFSQRSILIGSEYFLPYHKKYYSELKQRAQDLILAQYSPNIKEVQQFIEKYNINFWMIQPDAFSVDYVRQNNQISQLNPEAAIIVQNQLEIGIEPILSTLTKNCTVLQINDIIVLETNCILNTR